jgi:hypothetical protein
MGLTTDPNDPDLGRGVDTEEVGQNKKYLVLSEAELAKGFVRPVRTKYFHKGVLYDKGVDLLEQPEVYGDTTYVAVATVVSSQDGRRLGGRYLTQKELDQHTSTGGYIGGCGVETVMNEKIAETYASNPKFYSATYCVGCYKHLPVGEFVWSSDGEIVGS